jgi:hypothetical protein
LVEAQELLGFWQNVLRRKVKDVVQKKERERGRKEGGKN